MLQRSPNSLCSFRLQTIVVFFSLVTAIFAAAQSAPDSISELLKKPNLTPAEQWEILHPFLSKEATSWNGQYIDHAKTLLQLANDHYPEKRSEAYSILGEIHFNRNELDQAISAFQNGLDQVHQADSPRPQIHLLRGIGNIFYQQKQFEKALDYFRQSLYLARVQSDTLYRTMNHISLANVFVDQATFDSAAFHIYRAEDLAEAGTITEHLPTIYNNIIYLEDNSGNFEIARIYTFKLLELARVENDTEALVLGYGNLGYSYGKYDQRYDSAVHYLKLGLQYFDPGQSEPGFLPVFYQAISENYQQMGEADSALAYLQKYALLNDSLLQQQFDTRVQEIEARYQTEEKEKQLIQAQLETEKQNNLRRLTIGIAVGVIALLTGIFLYLRKRQQFLRRQTELSLEFEKTQAQQLKSLDQIKSNFFANISHEFRTPLTLILGPLEQSKRKALKGSLQQYADMMHRNALRLKDLIDQLLDLSKLESGKMQLEQKPGNVLQFIRQLVSSFESWALQKEIDYQFLIPDATCWVQYDQDKLEKILSNLISNAIKYTPHEGRIQLQFVLEVNEASTLLKVWIKDSGPGIPAADQDKIFQRFYQSNKAADGSASSGIGLALTKELIELHSGKISFESIEGEGTAFYIELPFITATAPVGDKAHADTGSPNYNNYSGVATPAELKSSPQPPAASVTDTSRPIILVVEDNEDVRRYIIEQISGPYHILTAKNGKEGLDVAFREIPDLIITDLMMPEMTGEELTRQLKTDQRTSHIPVIMLTAKADQQHKLQGLETGADDYLTKPFQIKELQVRIKNLIRQRKLLKDRFSKNSHSLRPKEIAVNSVDEKFLQQLLEILEKEIDNEKLSVEKVGRMIGMSRSQLHRKITALTDKTPTAFIRTFRMQRAHQLLSKKVGNAGEIAFMVGFSSLSYFSKCFKDEYGISPSDLLKKA